MTSEADITIYGGAAGGGKSWSLLVDPLRFVANPRFGAVLFRRTYAQISNEGSIWDESSAIYPWFDAKPNISGFFWEFPSGASISFGHFQHEKNITNWRSAQIAAILIDQLEQFTERQFWGLVERNRSTCGIRPYIKATCNPQPNWLGKLIEWWIDQQTGYPIPERAGRIRYLARDDTRLFWGDSAEEVSASVSGAIPLSVTFIPSRVTDNQVLLSTNPRYLANLMALPRVERLRQLGGNWLISESDGIFEVHRIRVVEEVPREAARIRYWDKAGTKDDGDFSAGVLIAKDRQGLFYIEDVVHGRWSPHERNQMILQTAQLDKARFSRVTIWIEQEPGSGGKESAEISIRELAGFDVHAERVTGDKVTRANPFAAQVEAGNVLVKAAPWTKDYLDELKSFPAGSHDDQVDASAGAFNKVVSLVVAAPKIYVPSGASVLDTLPKGTF